MGSGDNNPLIRLGEIVGVHGVTGWVKVFSDTDPREGIFSYSPWLIGRTQQADGEAQLTSIEVLDGGPRGKGLAAKLRDIDSREQAQSLIGQVIWIRRQQLPELEQGWYWADLEGLKVRNAQGEEFGTVSHMLATGANDVMVVKGERERLIPWLMGHTILAVDMTTGVIEVDWDAEF